MPASALRRWRFNCVNPLGEVERRTTLSVLLVLMLSTLLVVKVREQLKPPADRLLDQEMQKLSLFDQQHWHSFDSDAQRTADDGPYLLVKQSCPLQRELQRELRSIIFKSQHPHSCADHKYFVCDIYSCGFGCQMHHLVNCLRLGVRHKRIIVVRWTMDGGRWRYADSRCGKKELDCYFLPLSNCTNVSEMQYNGSINLSNLDRDWVPEHLAEAIAEMHDNPNLFVSAHLVEYILRPLPGLLQKYHHVKELRHFQRPVLGIHARGTDKYSEVDLFPLSAYLTMLFKDEEWHNVYLASEDANLLASTREFPNLNWLLSPYNRHSIKLYEMGDSRGVKVNAVAKHRYALVSVLHDVFMLAESDHFIGTDTSNIGRLVHELRQTLYVNGVNASWSVTRFFEGVRTFVWSQPVGI